MDAFRVLGPLDVTIAGQPARLGGRKPRMLLATLLLTPNTVVDVDTLIDVLWPGNPPRSAVANVRTYAHALRAETGQRLRSRSGGYSITVSPDELDMTTFEAYARTGRLDEASALWRGRVLADLPRSQVWEPTLARLDELRLSTLERSVAGRDDVIPQLRGLLAENPLREELWRQLVLGLHRAGRTAEALDAYGEVERVLAAELGTRPGPELRQARNEITVAMLADESDGRPEPGLRRTRNEIATSSLAAERDTGPEFAPQLTADSVTASQLATALAPRPEPSLQRTRPVVDSAVFPVRQLPLDIPDFTGRTAVLRHLTKLLRGPLPVVAALTGPPGVGKSTVAVHIGHRMARLFPDGQLYVDLRETDDPLNHLADTLGVPPARYRSALARRRVLLVLDNASDTPQITPLLPGSGGCAVLVTCRRTLPDLRGAVPVPIGPLSDAEAAELLVRVGGRRVTREPEHTGEVLAACGNLPLAVRVAGVKLASRPSVAVQVLAERLRDERGRLDELTIGGLAVRTSVTDSYARLTPEAARAFRFAGLLGPSSFPAWALAALLDRPRADDVLDSLVDANLVEVSGTTPRYRLPDLFRCYAGERLTAEPHREIQAATRRVLDGYLARATHAVARIPVPFFGLLPTQAGHASEGDPVEWLTAERSTISTLLANANQLGLHDHAWRIPAVYAPYFDLRGAHEDWGRSHRIALEGARQAGDLHGEAIVQRNIGQLNLYVDRYAEAESALNESLRLFAEAGDNSGVGVALAGIGTTLRIRGRYRDALAHHRRALRYFVKAGRPNFEAAARLSVGTDLLARQQFPAAEEWLTGARAMAVDIGDRHREAHALQRLAALRGSQGNAALALDHLAEVTAVFQQLGDDNCVAYARQETGELFLRTGDRERARELLTSSLDAHLRSGDRRSAAAVTHLLDQLQGRVGPGCVPTDDQQ